jgi:hypothetical protein
MTLKESQLSDELFQSLSCNGKPEVEDHTFNCTYPDKLLRKHTEMKNFSPSLSLFVSLYVYFASRFASYFGLCFDEEMRLNWKEITELR